MDKIRALQNIIFVRPDKAPDKIGSIIIPDSAQGKSSFGTVVAMGPGLLMADGSISPMPDIKPGDRVVYDSRHPFPEVVLNGEKLLKLRDDTVLGVVEE